MRIFIISPGADVAGMGYAFKRAFQAAGHSARAVCRWTSVLDYPTDLIWPPDDLKVGREVGRLFARADVVHVMEKPKVVKQFVGWQTKRIIVHQLGTMFRNDPAGQLELCRTYGAIPVAGTPDRHYVDPPLDWLPIVGDLDAWAALRTHKPSGSIRIAHAPTNRALKSTDAFIVAMDHLANRHDIDVDLIEGVSNRECLERKAKADIYFDETTLGFGVNAIEAWAMGIPVVSGIANAEHRAAMIADYGSLPFLEATEDTIEQTIERLIVDRDLRETWGDYGRDFAQRFFSQEAVVERAMSIYRAPAAVAA